MICPGGRSSQKKQCAQGRGVRAREEFGEQGVLGVAGRMGDILETIHRG